MIRQGRRLGIDVGTKRIGVALSDEHGILASPLLTVDGTLDVAVVWQKITELAGTEILEIYVGLPLGLTGTSTKSTELSREFALKLSALATSPVLLIDERLTTSLAQSQLREIGKSQKDARSTVDQMAAVAILEYALQMEQNLGKRPGTAVGNDGSDD